MSEKFIETDEVYLREFVIDDAEELHELDSDPEVRKYVHLDEAPPVDVIKETILPGFFAVALNHPGFGYWAAIEKSSGEFIGWFHLKPYKENEKIADLGFRLKRKYWGKGYATDVSKQLIDYAFEQLKVEKVIGIALPENKASIRVMEKVGMKFEEKFKHEVGEVVVKYGIGK